MQKAVATKWAYRTSEDGAGNNYTIKTRAYNAGLKLTSAALMFGAGWIAGEILDFIPYVNHAIPQAIQSVSHINVQDNLSGLAGIVSASYGAIRSRIVFDIPTCMPEYFTLYPILRERD